MPHLLEVFRVSLRDNVSPVPLTQVPLTGLGFGRLSLSQPVAALATPCSRAACSEPVPPSEQPAQRLLETGCIDQLRWPPSCTCCMPSLPGSSPVWQAAGRATHQALPCGQTSCCPAASDGVQAETLTATHAAAMDGQQRWLT